MRLKDKAVEITDAMMNNWDNFLLEMYEKNSVKYYEDLEEDADEEDE